jgi:hypothetical protein
MDCADLSVTFRFHSLLASSAGSFQSLGIACDVPRVGTFILYVCRAPDSGCGDIPEHLSFMGELIYACVHTLSGDGIMRAFSEVNNVGFWQ